MHQQRKTIARTRRRIPLAVTAATVGGICAPAAGQAQWPFPPLPATRPVVTVIGDSIIASGLPSGRTTLKATRKDAVNGKPVVIGQFVGTASAFAPFSVNTTAPTVRKRGGDCWQKGALTSALTPNLQPGDKLVFTGTSIAGTPPTTTVTVGTPAPGARPGPAPVCATLAPWARNAITSLPTGSVGASVSISGVAQKFATRVSLRASDGDTRTSRVLVTPSESGKWNARLPLTALADGAITIRPVFTVPDVSTGASARIAGPAIKVSKAPKGDRPL